MRVIPFYFKYATDIGLALVGSCSAIYNIREKILMSHQTVFIFVHGAWHGAWCYTLQVPARVIFDFESLFLCVYDNKLTY